MQIAYTANVARSGGSIIRVDIWDSDSDPVTLPVKFRGVVPTVSIKPTEITIRFCFINFPYSRTVIIENNSNLDGYFYIIPQPVIIELIFYA